MRFEQNFKYEIFICFQSFRCVIGVGGGVSIMFINSCKNVSLIPIVVFTYQLFFFFQKKY